MSLQTTSSTPGNEKGGWNLPAWIGISSLKNAQCIVSNIFLGRLHASTEVTFFANVPLRVWNCVNAIQQGKYYKVALDIVAIISLMSPLGTPGAIVCDCLAEGINVCTQCQRTEGQPEEPPLDCTIRENALKVLGLTEKEAQDRKILDRRYQDLSRDFDRRIEKSQHSKPLLKHVTRLRSQVEVAYKTCSIGSNNSWLWWK